jgi:protein gp37
MGVSVEDARQKHRIDHLRKVPAAVRFLSCEPLIGPLPRLNLRGIDWAIVGGESGARPRPMKPEWALGIRDQCLKRDVAFFFKQWGGRNKKAAGRELEGRHYDTFPTPKKRRTVFHST